MKKLLIKISKFNKLKWYEKINFLNNVFSIWKTKIIYGKSLLFLGKKSKIQKPLMITPKYISIGNNVSVFYNCRIQGISRYNNKLFSPKIIFDDKVSVQQNLHLTCAKKIYIGKNTAIAANVSITDIHHPYEDINIPIEKQNIKVKEVEIGEDCKIYNNSVILPGTKIGKHCTIGANSVVRGNFPDFCVIVGAPARIVKKYNFENKIWDRYIAE